MNPSTGRPMSASTKDKTWTVLELLNWTADHFQQAGLEDPRLNAELLLGKVLGLERIMLYARFEQPVSPGQRQEFRQLVKQRAARHPLQYLLGNWDFYGRQFQLTPAALIPRQETELLVERCLELLDDAPGRWATDVGTGSGVIAVTLAAERPRLNVVATDASPEALELAARNAADHGVSERVRFACGDLAEPVRDLLPGPQDGLDLLASNPPYVPTDEIERLAAEVRDHEPRIALDGGPDGLAVICRLIPQAAELLRPGGWLVLELGPDQADAVQTACDGTGAFDAASASTVTDAGGCRRVFSIRKSDA